MPEVERKRHLLRLWLAPAGARQLPAVFAECYGGLTIGDRGGIICQGTHLQYPCSRLNGATARKAGTADLPLHGRRVPRWLADRMTQLGTVISETIVHHYGRDQLLRRLAHR